MPPSAEWSLIMSNFIEKIKEKAKSPKGKMVIDKITTTLLILMFCSPLLILGYILLWFVMR